MEYRSTGTHYSNDVVAGVGSSHGVRLTGGSTGGIVEAVGDDANVALRLVAKGTAPVLIGNSSQSVVFGGASGLPFKGFFTSTNTWTIGATSSGQSGEVTFTSANFDVNPGDLIAAIEVGPTTNVLVYGGYRLSTAATSRLTVILANISSTATSTASGTIRLTWADLT